jgi:hypothetical protein
MRNIALAASVVGLIALASLIGPGWAEEKPAAGKAPGGYPDLIGGLKKSPGCLGVEAAQTRSGKQVIFAWFKDKRAVLKWYYSDVHRQAMASFFPEYDAQKPMKYIPEDSGPILAIASITLSDKPRFKESTMPISQIAIELYQPLPGGVFLGGRFTPKDVPMAHMREVIPQK